jgi:hypothetical protein
MKKQYFTFSQEYLVFLILFCCFSYHSYSQVGINTIKPGDGSILDIVSTEKGVFIPRINIIDLTTINPVTGVVGAAAELAATGLLVYNTSGTTGVGFYYWNGTDWVSVSGTATAEPPIDSVSLVSDVILNNSAYTDITGMSLTFIARKTSVLINMTASGFGTTNSMSIAYLRIFNVSSSSVIGGTMEKVQSFYDPSGPTSAWITTWSSVYSKLLTGLTVGNSYTIKVQGFGSPVVNGGQAVIYPLSSSDSNHLTLSVLQ